MSFSLCSSQQYSHLASAVYPFLSDEMRRNREVIVFMWLDGWPLSEPDLIPRSTDWNGGMWKEIICDTNGLISRLICLSWQRSAVHFSQSKCFTAHSPANVTLELKATAYVVFVCKIRFFLSQLLYLTIFMNRAPLLYTPQLSHGDSFINLLFIIWQMSLKTKLQVSTSLIMSLFPHKKFLAFWTWKTDPVHLKCSCTSELCQQSEAQLSDFIQQIM